LLEQHSESYKSWSAIIRINTEGKLLIMKLGPETNFIKYILSQTCHIYHIVPAIPCNIQQLLIRIIWQGMTYP